MKHEKSDAFKTKGHLVPVEDIVDAALLGSLDRVPQLRLQLDGRVLHDRVVRTKRSGPSRVSGPKGFKGLMLEKTLGCFVLHPC